MAYDQFVKYFSNIACDIVNPDSWIRMGNIEMVRFLQEAFPRKYEKIQEKCKCPHILEWRHKFHIRGYFRLMTLNLEGR